MLIRNKLLNLLLFLLTLLPIMLLSSCANVKNKAAGNIMPSAHIWEYLFEYGSEANGFATYTYVLVGRDESHVTSHNLYLQLIKNIMSSTHEASSTSDIPRVAKSRLNLFLIPVIRKPDNQVVPNNRLSIKLLTLLAAELPGKFSNPGPYLITLAKPIKDSIEGGIIDILVLDLTDMNTKAVREYVRAYKEHVVDAKPKGYEKLELLRLKLLDLACNIEDIVIFMPIAFEKLTEVFINNSQSIKAK